MKILMVNKFLYRRGGAESVVLETGEWFARHGHDVQYFGMYDQKNTVGNPAGLYTRNVDFHTKQLSRLLYPVRIIYSRDAAHKMRKLIDSFHPDVILMANINFQLTPSIIDAARSRRVPIIQTVHDSQITCPNHLLYDPTKNRRCEQCVKGTKWNCARNRCIHGSLPKSIIGAVESIFHRLRGSYEYVSCFICPSAFMEGMLRKDPRFHGNTKVLRNYIKRQDGGALSQKSNYVLFFGRLSEEKGIRLLMEAAKRLPHIPFVIAGTGPLSDLVEGQANVRWVGFQTGSDLNQLIAEALITVVPSICYENCPLSILESAALGTPSIGFALGGIPELIQDGVTGKIVGTVSAEDLAKGIDDLYADRALLKKMSDNCIQKNADLLDIDEYCGELLQVIDQTIRKKRVEG